MIRALTVLVILLAPAAAVPALSEPPRSEARLELQTGSVRVGIAAPGAPLSVGPDVSCWRAGCPLLAVRVRWESAAPQGPEGEPRRVQRYAAGHFQG